MERQYNFGVYPTMITPYNEDGSVDYETAKKYVQWYYDMGCDGIFAVCQSSEIFYLSTEEKVKLNKLVYDTVQELHQNGGRKMTVVSSGHTSDTIEAQAEELTAVWNSGSDNLIWITNRLDIHNEGDDVWIANAEKLLSLLPEDAMFGLYECPYPYKRLLTPKIIDWCIKTDRFYFVKDTCCDRAEIARRLEQMQGSHMYMFNANAQTLLFSLERGAKGYSSIMANFHPQLYKWLYDNYKSKPETAEKVQAFLAMVAFTEAGIPYPLTAKYHMTLEGIATNNISRARKSEEMTDYAKSCVEQMKQICDAVYGGLINEKA